jgi:nitroreductase/NAD-dependent dihydropyrimidine dehydrogenase PreA subunit
MSNWPVTIDQNLCVQCALCGKICPRHVVETVEHEGKKQTRVNAERSNLCLACGQCAAICAKGAIEVEGLPKAEYVDCQPLDIREEQLIRLFRQRRSVRRYKDQPVERAVLTKIAQAGLMAPAAAGRATTGVIIVDDAAKMKELMGHIYLLYEKMMKGYKNPIGRFIIKRGVGPRQAHTLETFLLPALKWYVHWYREGQGDELRRDAPAIMLFHGPGDVPVVEENCALATIHAILMAEVLGVGTLFNGLLPPGCNRSPEARRLIGLPDGHEVFTSLSLGYPKHTLKKVIPRPLTNMRFL